MKDNLEIEIITVGDELLQGQIVNTNAAYLGEKLTEAGISIGWMTTIGDSREVILDAFQRAAGRAKAVIITGGLGPTHDDLTKPCLVEFFEDRLVLREDLLAQVQKQFTDRGLPFPSESRNQAEFPADARDIPNPNGTATGIHYSREGVEWFALPGIPLEMRYMIEAYVLPRLLEIGLGQKVAVRVLRTTGIGESFLMRRLTRLVDAASLVDIAFLPRFFGVDFKLTARGETRGDLQWRLDQAESLLSPDLEPFLYGHGEETLAQVIGQLAKEKDWRLAVAESCTGGLIAKYFTDISGSSDYFERGVVCYSNQAKIELLGIPERLIQEQGAVSESVARAMAEGLLQRSAADLTVSVTGIAGPTGGSPEKPVGLTYLAVADRLSDARVEQFRFLGDRDSNRKRAAIAALKMLWDRLRSLII